MYRTRPTIPRQFLRISLVVSLAFFSIFSVACGSAAVKSQSTEPSSTPPNSNKPEKQTYTSVGVIKAIDIYGDRVTVDHEEIPGYMAAMEMNEMVSDHELLGGLAVGDKVEFEIARTGSTIVYTKFKKIGKASTTSAVGKEIYMANCAVCHGANGEGDKKGIPLTKGHALDHSEAEHIKQVTDGKGNKMPAFRDKLTPRQIAEVVKFVRNEIQAGITPEQRKGHHH